MAQQDNQQFQDKQVKQQPDVNADLKKNAGGKDDTKIDKDAGSCGTGSCGTSKKPQ